MDTTLLVVGVGALLLGVNALAPRKGRLLLVPSFFASWLTIELAPWWLLWHVVAGVWLPLAGGLDSARR